MKALCTFKSQDVKFFPTVSSWNTICRDSRDIFWWPRQVPPPLICGSPARCIVWLVVSCILGFRYTTRTHALLRWSRTRRPLSRGHYSGRSFLPRVFRACRVRLPYRSSTFHAHDRTRLKTAIRCRKHCLHEVYPRKRTDRLSQTYSRLRKRQFKARGPIVCIFIGLVLLQEIWGNL